MIRRFAAVAAICCSMLLAGTAWGSWPVGLYVLLEEVQLGPEGAAQPDWIKIRGVFLNDVAIGYWDEDRQAAFGPKEGWAYFRLPNRQRDAARKEWKELAGLATSRPVIAFGGFYETTKMPSEMSREFEVGQLVSDKPDKQVPYPVDHGMYKIGNFSPPAKVLRDYLEKHPLAK